MAQGRITYWDYIRLAPLLSLQGGVEGDEAALGNDEVLFIVVHQVDELWFKLVLRELAAVRDLLRSEPVPEQALSGAVRGVRRMATLLRLATDHFQLMETMTARDYLDFRDRLLGASGFQSFQLREIEILLGIEEGDRIPYGTERSFREALRNPDGSESEALRRVQARERDVAERGSLRQVLERWLYRTPIQGSTPEHPDDERVVRDFVEAFLERLDAERRRVEETMVATALTEEEVARLRERFAAERRSARSWLLAEEAPSEERARRRRVRAAVLFIESYRELPLLAWPRELLDALVEMEQAFVIFRQRHARMVERMIGRRTGTGGSAGVDYLDRTALRYRVLDELWAARALLLRRAALPPLRAAERYGLPPGPAGA